MSVYICQIVSTYYVKLFSTIIKFEENKISEIIKKLIFSQKSIQIPCIICLEFFSINLSQNWFSLKLSCCTHNRSFRLLWINDKKWIEIVYFLILKKMQFNHLSFPSKQEMYLNQIWCYEYKFHRYRSFIETQ